MSRMSKKLQGHDDKKQTQGNKGQLLLRNATLKYEENIKDTALRCREDSSWICFHFGIPHNKTAEARQLIQSHLLREHVWNNEFLKNYVKIKANDTDEVKLKEASARNRVDVASSRKCSTNEGAVNQSIAGRVDHMDTSQLGGWLPLSKQVSLVARCTHRDWLTKSNNKSEWMKSQRGFTATQC